MAKCWEPSPQGYFTLPRSEYHLNSCFISELYIQILLYYNFTFTSYGTIYYCSKVWDQDRFFIVYFIQQGSIKFVKKDKKYIYNVFSSSKNPDLFYQGLKILSNTTVLKHRDTEDWSKISLCHHRTKLCFFLNVLK